MEVREIMTPQPFCCVAFEPVQNAARMITACHVGSLPVVADQHSWTLRGIVTGRDLCAALADGTDPVTTPVEAVMTKDPVTCQPHDDVEICAKLMHERRVRRILVVDNHGRCIGIVAEVDLAGKGRLHAYREDACRL